MENPDRPEPVPQAQPSHCPDCNPRAHNHVHPGRYRDHCSVCHYLEGLEKEDPRLLASSTVRPVDQHGGHCQRCHTVREESGHTTIQPNCPGCYPKTPTPARHVDQHGFGPWPSSEQIEAALTSHRPPRASWDDSLQIGHFARLPVSQEVGFVIAGQWMSREGCCWTFCPVDEHGDKLDAAPVLRGEDARRLVESLAQTAPPEEIARRRAEARERLAANSRVELPQRPNPVTQRILSTLPACFLDRRILVVLRGLPGSGKSTVAQAIVDSDPARWVRVSKDDLRQMMVGPNGDLFRFVEDRAREMVVSKVAEETAMSALRLGLDVVVDTTNLTERALGSWRMAAIVANRDGHGPVLVCERAVDTSIEECVARDARRGKRSVGEAVIRRLAATIDLPLADRDWEAGS